MRRVSVELIEGGSRQSPTYVVGDLYEEPVVGHFLAVANIAPDDSFLRTSRIETVLTDGAVTIVKTKNSVYRIRNAERKTS